MRIRLLSHVYLAAFIMGGIAACNGGSSSSPVVPVKTPTATASSTVTPTPTATPSPTPTPLLGLYVANYSGGSVTEYELDASGNTAPVVAITNQPQPCPPPPHLA